VVSREKTTRYCGKVAERQKQTRKGLGDEVE